jgi:hypothetical protein
LLSFRWSSIRWASNLASRDGCPVGTAPEHRMGPSPTPVSWPSRDDAGGCCTTATLAGDPLPRDAELDGAVVQSAWRPLVARVGVPRPPRRVDRNPSVRTAARYHLSDEPLRLRAAHLVTEHWQSHHTLGRGAHFPPVQIPTKGEVVRVHATLHDRSKEHGAFASSVSSRSIRFRDLDKSALD